MKTIKNQKEIEKRIYAQYGVILEETASFLTQGGTGKGTESRFAYRWPY